MRIGNSAGRIGDFIEREVFLQDIQQLTGEPRFVQKKELFPVLVKHLKNRIDKRLEICLRHFGGGAVLREHFKEAAAKDFLFGGEVPVKGCPVDTCLSCYFANCNIIVIFCFHQLQKRFFHTALDQIVIEIFSSWQSDTSMKNVAVSDPSVQKN